MTSRTVTRTARRPKTPLAPVIQAKGSAVTTDGTWGMDHADLPGTPWAVIHRPTGIVVDGFVSTLTDCRAYVASGQALADLGRIQAHNRNEHAAERDAACPKC